MSQQAVAALLDCHGIARAPQVLVTGEDDDAVAAPVELLVSVVQDPSFGPLLACGAGGASAELLGDPGSPDHAHHRRRRAGDARGAAYV